MFKTALQRSWDIKIKLLNLMLVLFTYLVHQVPEEEWKDQTHLEVGRQNPQSAHPSFFQLDLGGGERGPGEKNKKIRDHVNLEEFTIY